MTTKPDKSDPVASKAAAPVVAPRAEVVPPPAISALLPPTAAVGDPSFTLRVIGTGFVPGSIIVFAGNDEPTTYFSATELFTGMNMPLWQGADPAISAQVRNPDGQESNIVNFVMQPPRAVPLDPAAASKPSPTMNQI
jgi:hypothetical protein